MITNYSKKTREFIFNLEIPSIQLMVTPIQVRILWRFVIQIMEFKKILDQMIAELKIDMGMSMDKIYKKKSRESVKDSYFHQQSDIFSSFMISISSELGGLEKRKKNSNENSSHVNNNDFFTSIMMENKEMQNDVQNFNKQCEKEMRRTMKEMPKDHSMSLSVEDFQAIKFTHHKSLHVELFTFNIYLLKYNPIHEYSRCWDHQKPLEQQKEKADN